MTKAVVQNARPCFSGLSAGLKRTTWALFKHRCSLMLNVSVDFHYLSVFLLVAKLPLFRSLFSILLFELNFDFLLYGLISS